ncbi:MAG: 3-isopropylmalate/(R)-2-methylmalate dehydratase small subunit [Myxococcota bacterium]|jgi:3-isopropylmalate/(R)-2-methylmalate dehydratase small subunit
MSLTGPALVLGDNVNTDQLHPSKFYSLNDAKVRSGFLGAVKGREGAAEQNLKGRIVVAGHNFGIGSSRETGARVFLLAGIQAVVAASFARIYYRNVLNLGLPAIVCPALEHARPPEGTVVTLDLAAGTLTIGDAVHPTDPLDPYWEQVLKAGGLVPYLGLG